MNFVAIVWSSYTAASTAQRLVEMNRTGSHLRPKIALRHGRKLGNDGTLGLGRRRCGTIEPPSFAGAFFLG